MHQINKENNTRMVSAQHQFQIKYKQRKRNKNELNIHKKERNV